jgi:IS30 family transposase
LGRGVGASLVTLVDRKNRFLLNSKAEKKDAISVKDTMIFCLKGQPCHSITPHRGMEFARHAEIPVALEKVKFYFPQSSDLDDVAEAYIQSKVDEMNKRPRKCLGFRTPYGVYYSTVLHLA